MRKHKSVEYEFFTCRIFFTIKDLVAYSNITGRNPRVKLMVVFPNSYPHAPPFIRVVYPRFHQYTGHITIGGSVCIQDLTTSGWNSTNHLDVFLIMIRNLLLEGQALINMDEPRDYSEHEARSAFNRVAREHGWQ